MIQKPMKPERGTPRAKRHMDLVAQTACACCRFLGYDTPVDHLHHPIMGRYSQTKTTDLCVIGLCQRHHDMLHRDRSEWVAIFGSESSMRRLTAARVERIQRNSI